MQVKFYRQRLESQNLHKFNFSQGLKSIQSCLMELVKRDYLRGVVLVQIDLLERRIELYLASHARYLPASIGCDGRLLLVVNDHSMRGTLCSLFD